MEARRFYELEKRREEKFWQLVEYVNNAGGLRPRAFDCGELGVCTMWFDRFGWRCTWWCIEPDPTAEEARE